MKNFLRVGSIQSSRRVLDSVFYWLIPHLKNCRAIICETWSISSIALNVARLLDRYRSEYDRPCLVDMLSRYHDKSDEIEDEIDGAVRHAKEANGQIVILMSAVMTGNSLQLLRESLEKRLGKDRFTFLAIYKLNPDMSDIAALCDLFGRDTDPEFDATPTAPSDTTVVSMDRHTYFPLHVAEKVLRITAKDARQYRKFFDRYKGLGALCLHRNAIDSNQQPIRHHGIYVDLIPMLLTEEFVQKMIEIIDALDKQPKYIIVPPHAAGEAFSEFVSVCLEKKFASKTRVIITSDIALPGPDYKPQTLSDLMKDDVVLVLDDVVVTGSRFTQFQKNLRDINYLGKIVYLTGVARPSSFSAWEDLCRHLSYRDGYDAQDCHRVHSVKFGDFARLANCKLPMVQRDRTFN